MNRLIITNGNIFDGYKFIGLKYILIEEGEIVNIAVILHSKWQNKQPYVINFLYFNDIQEM